VSSDIPKYAVFNSDITDISEENLGYLGAGETVADAVRDFKRAHMADVCNMLGLKAGSVLPVEVWTTQAFEDSDWYIDGSYEDVDYPFDYCIHKKIDEFNLVYEG